jgi:hypothetical protein
MVAIQVIAAPFVHMVCANLDLQFEINAAGIRVFVSANDDFWLGFTIL